MENSKSLKRNMAHNVLGDELTCQHCMYVHFHFVVYPIRGIEDPQMPTRR